MTDYRAAINKMKELRKLPSGWNYGRGGPLTERAHMMAFATLHYLNSIGANRFDILPSDDGGATILASFGDGMAEILVRKDGIFDLFLEADDCQEMEALDFGQLISALEDAGWQSPKSSGSQTHVFTVESTEDLPVKPLPTMGLVHLLWPRLAFTHRVGRCVTTSTNTIEDLAEPRLYFGALPPRPLLTAHG